MKKEAQFKVRKRRFSFETCENPMKKFDVQRILTVRKMNSYEKTNKIGAVTVPKNTENIRNIPVKNVP